MMRKAKQTPNRALQYALKVFKAHGGMLRTKDALREGIHPRTLYSMRDDGLIESISRGIYRLSNAVPLGNPDLVAVAMRIPDGVICLISALAYYELTTQIPHEVHVALPRGAEPPRIDHPPIRTYWFSGKAFTEGIVPHKIDRVNVRIYSREKTLADCFRYRNKIGMETCLEALREYRRQRRTDIDVLMRHAKTRGVVRAMKPYLEAIL